MAIKISGQDLEFELSNLQDLANQGETYLECRYGYFGRMKLLLRRLLSLNLMGFRWDHSYSIFQWPLFRWRGFHLPGIVMF